MWLYNLNVKNDFDDDPSFDDLSYYRVCVHSSYNIITLPTHAVGSWCNLFSTLENPSAQSVTRIHPSVTYESWLILQTPNSSNPEPSLVFLEYFNNIIKDSIWWNRRNLFVIAVSQKRIVIVALQMFSVPTLNNSCTTINVHFLFLQYTSNSTLFT